MARLDFSRAERIRVGEEKRNTLQSRDNSVTFEVSPGRSEGIVLKLEGDGGAYNYLIRVYDEAEDRIGFFAPGEIGETLVVKIPTVRNRGYFYVEVYTPDEEFVGKGFILSCDELNMIDEKDGDNEDFNTAQIISENDHVLGWADEDKDWDVYKITCGDGPSGRLQVILQPSDSYMRADVYLYDENRREIAKDYMSRGPVQLNVDASENRKYYLEINFLNKRDSGFRYLVHTRRQYVGGGSTGGSFEIRTAGGNLLTRPPFQTKEEKDSLLDLNIDTSQEIKISPDNIYRSKKYLFYCDNPEPVAFEHLAEQGCWLSKEFINGAGQVYLWHHNVTGKDIKACLLVYNPYDKDIVVESTNYGLTNGKWASDNNAWVDYFNCTNKKKITIKAHGYECLFEQSVKPDFNWGVVARTNVTFKNGGTAANAMFYDIAYINNPMGASKWAKPNVNINTGKLPEQQCRGLGTSYYNSFYLGEVSPNVNGVYFKFGSADAEDLISIVSKSDVVSNEGYNPGETMKLNGSFGQQLVLNFNVKNTFSSPKNFKVQIGSTGGWSFPTVFMKNQAYTQGWIPECKSVDMIETGVIAPNDVCKLSFSMVIPAISSSPYIVKVLPA